MRTEDAGRPGVHVHLSGVQVRALVQDDRQEGPVDMERRF